MTRQGLEAPHALTAGEWRPDKHGVMRWHETPPQPLEHDIALLIVCPFCRARISETCHSRNGKRCEPHSVRIIRSRRCRCGARLTKKSRKPSLMCEECRAAARRETWRLNKRQWRAKREAS